MPYFITVLLVILFWFFLYGILPNLVGIGLILLVKYLFKKLFSGRSQINQA